MSFKTLEIHTLSVIEANFANGEWQIVALEIADGKAKPSLPFTLIGLSITATNTSVLREGMHLIGNLSQDVRGQNVFNFTAFDLQWRTGKFTTHVMEGRTSNIRELLASKL